MTVEGNANSTVRVIAYGDLQCADSAAYRQMLDENLLPMYGHEVAFEDREFPLPKHEWARDAAIAAVYFSSISSQLAVAFRRHCFAYQGEIAKGDIAERIREFALLHGLEASVDMSPFAVQVDSEYNEGLARGVERTPTVWIRDHRFVETFTFEEISAAILQSLATSALYLRLPFHE